MPQQLGSSYNEMGFINQKLEKRVQFLETKATQLGISYVAFHMLVFLSVSRPSSNISCSQSWIPFSLSSLVAALFGVTFASAVMEWSRTAYEYDLNLLERQMVYGRMMSGQESIVMEVKPDMFREYKRRGVMWVLGCALLAYTLIILHASRSILCDAAEA